MPGIPVPFLHRVYTQTPAAPPPTSPPQQTGGRTARLVLLPAIYADVDLPISIRLAASGIAVGDPDELLILLI